MPPLVKVVKLATWTITRLMPSDKRQECVAFFAAIHHYLSLWQVDLLLLSFIIYLIRFIDSFERDKTTNSTKKESCTKLYTKNQYRIGKALFLEKAGRQYQSSTPFCLLAIDHMIVYYRIFIVCFSMHVFIALFFENVSELIYSEETDKSCIQENLFLN